MNYIATYKLQKIKIAYNRLLVYHTIQSRTYCVAIFATSNSRPAAIEPAYTCFFM